MLLVKASLVLLRSIVGPVSAKMDAPLDSACELLRLCSTWLAWKSVGLGGGASLEMSIAVESS